MCNGCLLPFVDRPCSWDYALYRPEIPLHKVAGKVHSCCLSCLENLVVETTLQVRCPLCVGELVEVLPASAWRVQMIVAEKRMKEEGEMHPEMRAKIDAENQPTKKRSLEADKPLGVLRPFTEIEMEQFNSKLELLKSTLGSSYQKIITMRGIAEMSGMPIRPDWEEDAVPVLNALLTRLQRTPDSQKCIRFVEKWRSTYLRTVKPKTSHAIQLFFPEQAEALHNYFCELEKIGAKDPQTTDKIWQKIATFLPPAEREKCRSKQIYLLLKRVSGRDGDLMEKLLHFCARPTSVVVPFSANEKEVLRSGVKELLKYTSVDIKQQLVWQLMCNMISIDPLQEEAAFETFTRKLVNDESPDAIPLLHSVRELWGATMIRGLGVKLMAGLGKRPRIQPPH